VYIYIFSNNIMHLNAIKANNPRHSGPAAPATLTRSRACAGR
jgi:hypothetical protein